MTNRRDLLKGTAGILFLNSASANPDVEYAPLVLSSIEELKNLNIESDLVLVKSYYKNNENIGGGFFIWNQGQPKKTIDGMFIVSNIRKGGYWQRSIENGVVNPEQFGAKGNGLYDDSFSFSEMFKYLQTSHSNCRVELLSEVYKLESWKPFLLNFSLVIQGRDSKIIGFDQDFIIVKNSISCSDVEFTGFRSIFFVPKTGIFFNRFELVNIVARECSNMVHWLEGEALSGCERIIIDGCVGSGLGNRFVFIQATNFESVVVKNCTVSNVANHGLLIGSNKEDYFYSRKSVNVINCTFQNIISTGAGIYSASEGGYSAHNEGGSETQGILIYCYKVIVRGNTIQDVGFSKAGDSEGVYLKCQVVTVVFNLFVNAGGSPDGFLAIKDFRAEADSENDQLMEYRVLISGNSFKATGGRSSLAISCQRSNVNITANKFLGHFSSVDFMIRLYGLLTGINISDNEFRFVDYGLKKSFGGVLISDSVEEFKCVNNIFSNWNQSAIRFQGDYLKNAIISNNIFSDCGGKETLSRVLDLNLLNYVRGLVFSSNSISSLRWVYVEAGFKVSGVSNAIFSNNVINDVVDYSGMHIKGSYNIEFYGNIIY